MIREVSIKEIEMLTGDMKHRFMWCFLSVGDYHFCLGESTKDLGEFNFVLKIKTGNGKTRYIKCNWLCVIHKSAVTERGLDKLGNGELKRVYTLLKNAVLKNELCVSSFVVQDGYVYEKRAEQSAKFTNPIMDFLKGVL